MQNEKIKPEGAYQTLMVLWGALLMSQFLFLVIVFVIKPELLSLDLSKPLLGNDGVIVMALAAVSLSTLGASFVLRKKYLAQSVAEQKIELVQTALIIGCALAESVSLFGLLLAFVFDYQYFFFFSALGILGTLAHFPRRDDVHAANFRPREL